MRALRNKDEDMITHFDKIKKFQAEINNTSLKHLLIINHDVPAKKEKVKVTYLLKMFLHFGRHLKSLLNN